MQLYRRMAAEDRAGVFQFAPDFTFVAAPEWLEAQPKLSQTYGGTTPTANAYRYSTLTLLKKRKDIEGAFAMSNGNLNGSRPNWGKKAKKYRRRKRNFEKSLTEQLAGIQAAMQESNAKANENFQQLPDIKLLSEMEDVEDKKTMYSAILEERKVRILQRTEKLRSLARRNDETNESLVSRISSIE